MFISEEIKEVNETLNISIKDYEIGESVPTIELLEQLKTLYKTPIANFYRDKIPTKKDLRGEKKMSSNKILIILILICVLSFGVGLITYHYYEKITFNQFELGIYVEKQIKVSGKVISKEDLRLEVKDNLGKYYKSYTARQIYDGKYFIFDENSYKELLYNFDNIFYYVTDQFDCDNYSRIFESFIVLSTLEQSLKSQITIGVMEFFYTKEGEPKGHSINIVPIYNAENDGIEFIISEPQTATNPYLRNMLKDTTMTEDDKISYVFEQTTTDLDEYMSNYIDLRIGCIKF